MKIDVKPNLLDRIVASFSPESGVKRLIARQKYNAFSYEAARITRARGIPPGLQSSESSKNQGDRIQMMRVARDSADNIGFVKSLLSKTADYVCGKLIYHPNTGDRNIDNAYKQYLSNCFANCDITGRHSFRELMRLAIMATKLDGDMGFIIIKRKDMPPALQSIEADRIGGDQAGQSYEKYFGGIKIDSSGVPVSYKIYDRDPSGAYTNPREIKAESFIHLFNPRRLDQYRGVTDFHSCLNTLVDIKEIIDFEKQACKWASAQAGVLISDGGEDNSGYNFDETTQDPNNNALRLMTMEPGKINILNKGEDMKVFDSSRPSPAFQGLLNLLYREVCISQDLPFGFMYDMSELKGPTARLESAQAHRAFDRWQNLLEDKVLNRIKAIWLNYGIAKKEIPDSKNWTHGRWMFPAHPTIDVGRESAANLNENRQGLKSAANIYGEQGLDWLEELEQMGKEAAEIVRIAKDNDVPVNMIQMLTPNGNGIEDGEGGQESPTRDKKSDMSRLKRKFNLSEGETFDGEVKKNIVLKKEKGQVIGSEVTEVYIPRREVKTNKQIKFTTNVDGTIGGVNIKEI